MALVNSIFTSRCSRELHRTSQDHVSNLQTKLVTKILNEKIIKYPTFGTVPLHNPLRGERFLSSMTTHPTFKLSLCYGIFKIFFVYFQDVIFTLQDWRILCWKSIIIRVNTWLTSYGSWNTQEMKDWWHLSTYYPMTWSS